MSDGRDATTRKNTPPLPTVPLMLRVDYPYRTAFDRATNRFIRRHWSRSAVYRAAERRERRFTRCVAQQLRSLIGDEAYDDFVWSLGLPEPPPLAVDRVARHHGFVDGVPPCSDGPLCAEHGWELSPFVTGEAVV